jgi:hypothetical protein
MSAAGIITFVLAVGLLCVAAYWFLHYWLEVRPLAKKLRRDSENGLLRPDENENIPSGPPFKSSVLSSSPPENDDVCGEASESHPLVADVERRRARAAKRLEDEELEDISPPESVGDFRRSASNRSRHSESRSVGGEEGPPPDRASPSVLYPSICE